MIRTGNQRRHPLARSRPATTVIASALALLTVAGCSNPPPPAPSRVDQHGLPVATTLWAEKVTASMCPNSTQQITYDPTTGAPTEATFIVNKGGDIYSQVKVKVSKGGRVHPTDAQDVSPASPGSFSIAGANHNTKVSLQGESKAGRDICETSNRAAELAPYRDLSAERARRKPTPVDCPGISIGDQGFKVTSTLTAKARSNPPAIRVGVKVSSSGRFIDAISLRPGGIANAVVKPDSSNPTIAKRGTWRFTITGSRLNTELGTRVEFHKHSSKLVATCVVRTPVAWPEPS